MPSYHFFYGDVQNSIYLSNSMNMSLYFYANLTNVTGNILVADEDSIISFSQLQALGRTTSNASASGDFAQADASLNMTGFKDSLSQVFTAGSATPTRTRNLTVFSKVINHVPIANSTNNSNFITGIIWDMSDGGTEYTGNQDLLFLTEINTQKPGAYGTYDYEIRVPVNLRSQTGSNPSVAFYWEITNTSS